MKGEGYLVLSRMQSSTGKDTICVISLKREKSMIVHKGIENRMLSLSTLRCVHRALCLPPRAVTILGQSFMTLLVSASVAVQHVYRLCCSKAVAWRLYIPSNALGPDENL